MAGLRLSVLALVASVMLSSCTQYDIGRLAGDDTAGRNNGTPGSALARQFLIEQLKPISQGLNSAETGDAAYTQTLAGGTNVVSGIRGTDLAEEYVVVGAYYADHPLVPLADTVGYVNFDIQGANLLPSLRNTSFAVAAESGGDRFEQIVRAAINAGTLDTETLSSIFGQNRSDYVSFLGKQVPRVFFTDATGPCYHTNEDEIGVVDFRKLDQQIAIALRVTRELANTDNPPAFAPNTPLVTYSDAVVLQRAMELIWRDRDRFSAEDQQTLTNIRADLTRIVLDGRAAFGSDDVSTVLGHAATVVISLLPKGECDGFLTPAEERQARALEDFVLQSRAR